MRQELFHAKNNCSPQCWGFSKNNLSQTDFQMTMHQYPEERRSATVLFADVQGFTSLAEQLDFETVSDLIKEMWSRLDFVIEEAGGYIDKHMGDGVMAIWGAPYATDRDAEKAVHTGLAMIAALNTFTRNSNIPGAEKLNLRVGINSGQVFAGYVGTKNEYTVIGDTVNVAARLEQAAEPGTTLVGEGTAHLIHNIFEIKETPPILAKGKTEPIKAYQIIGTRPSSSKITYDSLEKLETHMVGRDGEMSRLRIHFEQSRSSITPTLILITGEVGIGKSRLLMEFSHKLQSEVPLVQIITTRALAQTARVPYNTWKQILFRYFGLLEEASPEENGRYFKMGIELIWGEKLPEKSVADAIYTMGSLIGLNVQLNSGSILQAGSILDEITHAEDLARELLYRILTKGPLVISIDDLQWADKESLNLLHSLLRPGKEPLPLLIIGGTRLSLLKDYPHWWNASHIMTLNPLLIDAEMVAMAYPDLRSLPKHILEELASRAEGNPYFLEEIVKGLVKSGIDEIKSTPDITLAQIQTLIPESLRAMLQARLDNLTREARSVALMASVIGRVFWVGAIKEIARANTGTGTLTTMPEQVVDRLLQDGLRQLVRAEMAFPRSGTKYSDQQEYIFKNSHLRDVAYGMIPHKSRNTYHRAVAQWLAKFEGTIYKVMAAEHFEKCGEFSLAAEQYDKAVDMANTRKTLGEIDNLTRRSKAAREAAQKGRDDDQ
jgi:class 3 adenylate cyclase